MALLNLAKVAPKVAPKIAPKAKSCAKKQRQNMGGSPDVSHT